MEADDKDLYLDNDRRFDVSEGQTRKIINEFQTISNLGIVNTFAEFWPVKTVESGSIGLSDIETFWQKVLATQRPNEAFIDFIEKNLAGKYRLAVLSNFTPDLTEYIKRYDIKHLFDQVFISAILKIAKPDPAIYTHALQVMNVSPEQSLFIDDKQKNVETALYLGMNGIIFTKTDEVIVRIKKML